MIFISGSFCHFYSIYLVGGRREFWTLNKRSPPRGTLRIWPPLSLLAVCVRYKCYYGCTYIIHISMYIARSLVVFANRILNPVSLGYGFWHFKRRKFTTWVQPHIAQGLFVLFEFNRIHTGGVSSNCYWYNYTRLMCVCTLHRTRVVVHTSSKFIIILIIFRF